VIVTRGYGPSGQLIVTRGFGLVEIVFIRVMEIIELESFITKEVDLRSGLDGRGGA